MTLTIYLADLTHTGNGIATEAFPLNIGLISSYARRIYGDSVDITLFKYPEDLLHALKERPPHILGCSNYTWNVNLSHHFTRIAKAIDPEILTVWGGTNYPFDAANQEAFLRQRDGVDVHTFYEGEQAFANLVERFLSGGSRAETLREPIGGCQFLHPETGEFMNGGRLPRIKNLDDIPSPYTTGLLDKFFDGVLTPLVETARGCPFRCNFCNAGEAYFSKVNKFSDVYVEEELTYIAKKAAAAEIGHATFADNNFGMIPRDHQTVKTIHHLQETYGWPRTLTVWTGKNSKERVIDATRLLGESLVISMSVQSVDEQVMENISRDNIKLEHFQAIAEELHQQGRPQLAEVIMPLPGETFETHVHGLSALLDSKVSRVLSHTLQMLHGTPYKDDLAFIEGNDYRTAWRIVPLDFSEIDGTRIFDVEEVAYATKDMTFEEYLEARKYMLVIELCRNSNIFRALERYLAERKVPMSAWIREVYDTLNEMPEEVRSVIESFVAESRGELWESEEALVAHYREDDNYRKLVEGEVGGNVLFKHRILILARAAEAFVGHVHDVAASVVLRDAAEEDAAAIRAEIDALKTYTAGSISECHGPETLDLVLEKRLDYDVPAWLTSVPETPLATFRQASPVSLQFTFRDKDKLIFRDAYKRYGSDTKGIIKLIQRIGNAPFRRARYTTD